PRVRRRGNLRRRPARIPPGYRMGMGEIASSVRLPLPRRLPDTTHPAAFRSSACFPEQLEPPLEILLRWLVLAVIRQDDRRLVKRLEEVEHRAILFLEGGQSDVHLKVRTDT